MNSINDPRLMRVVDFGQLPQGIIYRQVEEVSGITLETYIQQKVAGLSAKIEESAAAIEEMGKGKFPKFANNQPSKHTFFTEVEGIDVCLKILNLLELVHEKDLIYSNLCPEEIFLKNKSLGSLCFTSLYHCIGDALSSLGIEMPDQLTTCDYDARTRNQDYISPEQNVLAKELL